MGDFVGEQEMSSIALEEGDLSDPELKHLQAYFEKTEQTYDDSGDVEAEEPPAKRQCIDEEEAPFINLSVLCELTRTTDLTVEFCRSMGLLPKFVLCPNCGRVLDTLLPWKPGSKTSRLAFQCGKKVCKNSFNFKVSARKNTFFEGQKFPMQKTLMIAYAFVARLTPKQATVELSDPSTQSQISTITLCQMYNFCRQVCVNAVLNRNTKLGGPGFSVEIDEDKVRHSSTDWHEMDENNGKWQWALSGICRETDQCFVVIVEERTEKNLISIIEDKVEKGTTIYTNGLRDFSGLKESEYNHLIVDYSTMKDMQTVWSEVKSFLPIRESKNHNMSDSLAEYSWRKGRHPSTIFYDFLREVVKQFPGPCPELNS